MKIALSVGVLLCLGSAALAAPPPYPLPPEGSGAWERHIVQPALETCKIAAGLAANESERAAFMAECPRKTIEMCKESYVNRGFC